MKIFQPAVTSCVLLVLATLAFAQTDIAPTSRSSRLETSWPGFRGTGDSHTSAANLPTQWSTDENLAWTIALSGYGQSSPVIWGDRLFVTAVEGKNKERCQVSCYRTADGFLLWSRGFDASMQMESSKMVSRGAPTPLVDADRVYALFESGDLFALDHRGNTAWSRSLTDDFGGRYQGNHGFGSSLVGVPGGLVALFDHDGPSFVTRIDRATGATSWKTDRQSRISWATPTYDRARGEVIVSSSGSVDGYDVDSGSQVWTIPDITGNTVPSVTMAGDLIFVGLSEGKSLAISHTSSGAEIAWQSNRATPSGFGSPLSHGETILIVNKAGVMSCIDSRTGEVRYKQRLAESCWVSPIAAGELVYAFGKSGKTTVLQLEDGKAEIVAENELPTEGTVYGVAVTDDSLFVREGDRLLCIRATEQPR